MRLQCFRRSKKNRPLAPVYRRIVISYHDLARY
nr:MAG TPA: hypothetical protein [Caudoviricetes sp.]